MRLRASRATTRHDLSALKIFNTTLVRIKDRYVDPSRIDPKKMLYAALDRCSSTSPRCSSSRRRPQQGDGRGQRQAGGVRHRRCRLAVAPAAQAQEDLPLHRDEHERRRRPREGRVRGGQRHAVDARSALDPDGPRAGARHGRVDERQVRRPRHRDPDDRPQAHGREADEGHAGVEARASRPAITSSRSTTSRPRTSPRTRRSIACAATRRPASRCGSSARARRTCCASISCATSFASRRSSTSCSTRSVGYIKVKQFSKGIAQRRRARRCRRCRARARPSWILDLRGNPGGLLEEAVQLSRPVRRSAARS